ncbi:MAG: HypC/HybG/HupF family hydrogenase formation chaperone [Dermatophilaceae bacterium]
MSGSSAVARLGDRVLSVSLVTLGETVAAGDWVVVHSGFALHRLEPAEAAEALALRAEAGHPSMPPVSMHDATSRRPEPTRVRLPPVESPHRPSPQHQEES